MFFSQIWAIVIYLTCHMISPFTVYQYYLTKGFCNEMLDWSTLWSDRKPTE